MPDQLQPTIKEQRDLKSEEKERRRNMAARQNRTKNIITWSIIGLVLAGIVTLIVASGGGKGSSNAPVATVDSAVDHVQGSLTTKALLIEYSDFQCPACGAYYPTSAATSDVVGTGDFTNAEFHMTMGDQHCGDAACAGCDPMERYVDGLIVRECLERYEAWQREDVRDTRWAKTRKLRDGYLSLAQVTAAREAWSLALKGKQAAAREKERCQVVCDPQDEP